MKRIPVQALAQFPRSLFWRCAMSVFHFVDRRSVLGAAIAIVFAQSSAAAIAAKRLKRVLFICQYGSVKSPIARELFRRRAKERGIAVIAWSRGITPEAHISPALLDTLKAEGIDPEVDGLHKLARGELRQADITVLFDPLPGKWHKNGLHDWIDTGSFNTSYEVEKPKLMRRIDQIFDELIAQ
jgi:Low molecular weight phosphotyrosine protein phosphatase